MATWRNWAGNQIAHPVSIDSPRDVGELAAIVAEASSRGQKVKAVGSGHSFTSAAATDGRKFYYNTEFCNKLKPKELEFLFGHEVLHNVYDHMGRNGERDRRLFNCAADYCVNQMLDEHLDGKETDDGEDGDEVDGSGKGRPRLSKEERDAIKDEIREALLQAAQATGAGDLPAGVKRLIKDLTQPVVNWRELLEQQIQSTVKDDYSWLRPNRRSWHMDAVMPGMKPGTQIDVCIAIDTSGSIGNEDIKAFMAEIKGIMEAYDEYKIQVWSFDTEVYNHQVYSSDSISDILEYEPMGGGGTDFMANWKYMKEEQIEPKKFIMFTDGMPYGEWGDEDYCDTVFIIKGNEQAEPPFGVWAIYERAKELAKA